MSRKTAFITGISGQDGSYLSELLLSKGYRVTGILRRHSIAENQDNRIAHLDSQIETTYGDLTDTVSLMSALRRYQPDEVYNLAGQSHVRISFDKPVYTAQVNAMGVVNLLGAILEICPQARFYQASSSEMFGNSIDADGYQREMTPMRPVSPYGCAKLYAYSIVSHYRRAHKMFACNGILFNHESPRRGSNFVTAKVIKTAVEIKMGLVKELVLGNMDARRDWGHSRDYVRAMWMMLQREEPDDYVVATGQTRTVRDFCEQVFKKLGLGDYKQYVRQDQKFMRAEELNLLQGDPSKAQAVLGWQPQTSFGEMVDEITEHWQHALAHKATGITPDAA